jgi:hypothetical protein
MTDSGTLFSALLASLWWENSAVGRILIACILCLLGHAWLATRRHLRRYRGENASLDRVIARLDQWRAGRAPDDSEQSADAPAPAAGTEPAPFPTAPPAAGAAAAPAATSPPPAATAPPPPALAATAPPPPASTWLSLERGRQQGVADIETLQEGVDRSSLIAERLAAIAKMRRFQVKISLATLQQLTRAKETARAGMSAPAFAAGTAMMLGLLGTFIGLAVMAQRIYFALPTSAAGTSVASWTGAFQNVTAVLAGIKIAFSTSLVGIFCAVVASALGHRLKSAQAAFAERLERFTAEDLLPATVPSVEDESLLERVTLQIENAFVQLDDVFRQNADALKEMTGAQGAMVEIVGEIRQATSNDASRNFAGLVEQVTATHRSVLTLIEHLARLVSALDGSQRRLTAQLAEQRAAPEAPPAAGSASRPSSPPSSAAAAWIVAAVLGLLLVLTLRLFPH